jgi:hypothetical protein
MQRLALQPAVAGLGNLRARLFEPADARDPRCGLVDRLAAREFAIETARELPPEHQPQRLEPGLIARLQLAAARRLEHLECQTQHRRVLLGHEGTEAGRERRRTERGR